MTQPYPDARLQALWLDQLHREFIEICSGYGVELRPPLFALSAAEHQLGSWCPQTRQLSLSWRLIAGQPWSVTLQVLKHEMAHQLCSEQFRSFAKPHGERFQQACGLLGVLPQFRRAEALLPTDLAAAAGSSLSAPGRRCIDRVKKLLALAESANEHEAALALHKARELVARHQLDGIEAGGDADAFACVVIDRQSKRIARYQRQICTLLGEFFQVRCILVNLFRPGDGQYSRVIQIFGGKADVAVAEYCYHFLESRLAALWEARRRLLEGAARRARYSYYLGVLRGFREKLQHQRNHPSQMQVTPGDRDLLVLAGGELDRYIGLYHPRLCRRRAPVAKVSVEIFQEGVSAGRAISFAQGIERSAGGARALIPASHPRRTTAGR